MGKGSSRYRGPAYLLPGNGHVILDIPEHSGLDEEASVSSRVAPTHQFGSFSLSRADVAQDLIELLLIHLHR